MNWPPGGRDAPTAESAPHEAANHDRDVSNRTAANCGESRLPRLTLAQAVAYGAVWLAAERSIAAPCNEELLDLTGFSSYSQPNKIFRQLERRGLLEVHGFQRGRQVHVIKTGKTTAAPQCRQIHWRHRGKSRG